jgi:hypothetical protein
MLMQTMQEILVGQEQWKKQCRWYLSDRGEKNPGALSFDAMYRVRPGGIHFAILFLMYSGRVSLSR